MKMNKRPSPKIVAVIPARYDSQRFPGKPLVSISGKSLIRRTYENALLCKGLDKALVATDDRRIMDHVEEFGGEAIMTSPKCPTGTDRLVEVLHKSRFCNDADIIVNIQGDEPCLSQEAISAIIDLLLKDDSSVMSTAVTPISSKEEASLPSVVKCVFDKNYNALYFSRALIPSGKTKEKLKASQHYRHIGIYAFRKDFLPIYGELSPTPLQLSEDLEQLKVLEHGYRIKVAVVKDDAIGVDTPEDISKVESFLCSQNTFSSQGE